MRGGAGPLRDLISSSRDDGAARADESCAGARNGSWTGDNFGAPRTGTPEALQKGPRRPRTAFRPCLPFLQGWRARPPSQATCRGSPPIGPRRGERVPFGGFRGIPACARRSHQRSCWQPHWCRRRPLRRRTSGSRPAGRRVWAWAMSLTRPETSREGSLATARPRSATRDGRVRPAQGTDRRAATSPTI